MTGVEVQAYTTAKSGRQSFPVPSADTTLSSAFAWVAAAVSSAPLAAPTELAAEPVPDILPVLRSFQGILNRLPAQADEGDLAGLGEEVSSWSGERLRATRVLLDD
jgi:hypothetical protein